MKLIYNNNKKKYLLLFCFDEKIKMKKAMDPNVKIQFKQALVCAINAPNTIQ